MAGQIGFSGTRYGMSINQKADLRAFLVLMKRDGFDTFRHGDCLGADAEAHLLARELGYKIVVHPPINDSWQAHCKGDIELEPRPYLERNDGIIAASDVIVCAPQDDKKKSRGGTWYVINRARLKKKPLTILER